MLSLSFVLIFYNDFFFVLFGSMEYSWKYVTTTSVAVVVKYILIT
jgi:hypothetical protein